MEEKIQKKGQCIITEKRRLYTNNEGYIRKTQEIYNKTALKYYNLLLEHMELLELSNQNCLRELEKLTLKSKSGKKPENYFETDVPSYLRRAAINYAIGIARTYDAKYKNYLENKEKVKEPKKAKQFNVPGKMVLEKGEEIIL